MYFTEMKDVLYRSDQNGKFCPLQSISSTHTPNPLSSGWSSFGSISWSFPITIQFGQSKFLKVAVTRSAENLAPEFGEIGERMGAGRKSEFTKSNKSNFSTLQGKRHRGGKVKRQLHSFVFPPTLKRSIFASQGKPSQNENAAT